MRLLISMLSILGGLHGLLEACSCGKVATPCNTLADTPVVVVARVIRDSGEGLGSGPGRVVIEEVLKGLDKEVRELEVDSSAMTSCYMRLQLNERYLLFGSVQGGMFRNHVCSGSGRLRGNQLLLGALRAAAAQSAPRLIGAVQIAAAQYGAGKPAEPGVRIIAEQGERRLEARTIHDGQFEFPNIEPGDWRLRVDSPGLVHREQWPSGPIQVPATGCEIRWLTAAQDGRIAGRVTNRDGQPVARIPVQAFDFNKRGQMESSPYAEAKTDREGRYEIIGLPSQEYVVAINGKKYSDEFAHAPVYYPGTRKPSSAKRVQVVGTKVTQGIDITVGPPRQQAELIVEAVDEEGLPLDDVGAKVLDLEGVQRAYASAKQASTLLMIPVWIGETYRVEASRFKSERVPGTISPERGSLFDDRVGAAGPIHITEPTTRIRVVLRPRKP